MKALILLIALAPVAFAGPLDNPTTGGVQPSSGGLAAGPRAFKLTGVVFQKLPTGLIIDASGKKGGGRPVGLIYVEGNFPKHFNEMPFSMNVADAGTYSYGSAGGSAEVIRKMVPAR